MGAVAGYLANTLMKTISKQIFCALLSLAIAVVPVRPAHAVVPVLALGLAAVTSTGVTITAADLAGLAIAAAGLGALAYLKITEPGGSSVAVPAKDLEVIPPPVAPGTAAQIPASNTYYFGYGVDQYTIGYNYSDSYANSCASLGGYYFTSNQRCQVTLAICQTIYSSGCYEGIQLNGGTYNASVPASCPAGYVVSGSSCVLSNPNAAVQDERQDFTRSGVVFAPVADDLAGTMAANQGTVNTNADAVSVVGESGGKRSSITIVADVGGGTTVKQATQQTDSTGASYVKVTGLSIGADGVLRGESTYNYSGELAPDVGTSGGYDVLSAPAGAIPASPVSPGGTSAIDLPTDYNRETTQQQLRDAVIAGSANATVGAGVVSDAAALAAAYQDQATAVDERLNGFGLPSLPGFLFPQFSSPECLPIGWTFQGHEVSFDICPHVPTIKSIAAWILNLLAAALCFQMLMNFRAMRLRG